MVPGLIGLTMYEGNTDNKIPSQKSVQMMRLQNENVLACMSLLQQVPKATPEDRYVSFYTAEGQ